MDAWCASVPAFASFPRVRQIVGEYAANVQQPCADAAEIVRVERELTPQAFQQPCANAAEIGRVERELTPQTLRQTSGSFPIELRPLPGSPPQNCR